MCVLHDIGVAIFGKLPVGETVEITDVLLPDVDNLHILLGECLDGAAGALEACIDICVQFAVLLVIGKFAGDDGGCTLGGECYRVVATGEVGLVGNTQVAFHTGEHPGCNINQVFGFIPIFGAIGDCDGLLVVAVPVGMVGSLEGEDVDVVLLAGAEVDKSLADCILILRSAEVLGSNLDGCGKRLSLFPSRVGTGCRINDFGQLESAHIVLRIFRFDLILFTA